MKKVFALLVLLLFVAQACAGEPQVTERQVYVLKVNGIIDSVIGDYVARGIEDAREKGAEAVILQLDTPGGMDAAMRSVIETIFDSPVPVIAYVYPDGARAASAGSFILMSSHVAAMAHATNVGAAHPVSMTGELDKVTAEKVANDAAAYMRSIAGRRNRNTSMAASFVLNSTSISAEEAMASGIIDTIASNYTALLSQIHGMRVEVKSIHKALNTKDAKIVEFPMNAKEELLHAISHPNIAYILFIAGIYGIIFELSTPGAILPGVIGGICILLSFLSFQALSINATGVLLIIFALILFIADMKAPTHGVLTGGGIISLFLGSIMLINPENEPFIKISLGVIIPMTLITAFFFVFAIGLVIKAHRKKPTTGGEGMMGLIGEARTTLNPNGGVFVRGEWWAAKAAGSPIKKGKKVRVVGIEKLVLIVEEA